MSCHVSCCVRVLLCPVCRSCLFHNRNLTNSWEKKHPICTKGKHLSPSIHFPHLFPYESIKCWLEVIKSNPDVYYTVELHRKSKSFPF
ncbi:hypothetical protein AAZX31_02G188900 [Glycine max]